MKSGEYQSPDFFASSLMHVPVMQKHVISYIPDETFRLKFSQPKKK